MKKSSFLILLLTAILLVTSCSTAAYPVPAAATPEATPVATVAPTPAPTATPIPTPEPTREPSSTSFEFTKKYCEIYGDAYTEEFAAAFNHAMWTMPSDYSNIRADLPRYLYEHPYNMWAQTTLKKDYAFKSNAELVAELGISEVTAIMEAAKGFSKTDLNYDYSTVEEEVLAKQFYYYLPSFMEDTTLVPNMLRDKKKSKNIGSGVFITDSSLVYQCTDGMLRVRGRAVFRDMYASDTYLKDNEYELDKWYCYDIEFNVILDTPSATSKYEHGKYGVYNWVYLSNGFTEADAATISLAEAQMA